MRRLLSPFALLYRGVIGARNLYYDHVPGATHHADLPVVSVGNLTLGGTGKTPLGLALVQKLQASDHRPAILTRGYKTPPGGTADEVLEFHEALPSVPVIVNPDRVAGAAEARQQHNVDCLVLDDGFQHRRLARDLDIVLIDALYPWGSFSQPAWKARDGIPHHVCTSSGPHLLPAGHLREPPGSLRRADVLVLTRADLVARAHLACVTDEVQHYAGEKPVLNAVVEPDALVYRDGRRAPPAELAGRHVVGVCGIGNPEQFHLFLRGLAGHEHPTFGYADHCQYSPANVREIQRRAATEKADLVVTTRKDWVKLAPLWPDSGPGLVRLDVRLELGGAVNELDARLRQAVEKRL